VTSKPTWFRLDADLFDNPKIMRAGTEATLLWMRGIAYSARHLTDGWIPEPLPKRWGYTRKHTETLERHVLWIPLEITDDGGWLINDYADYQPTRAEWGEYIEKRKAAGRAGAAKRWGHT